MIGKAGVSPTKPTVGFIGLGRMGLPIAVNLVAAGYKVVASGRGRSADLVASGGFVAGDGSAAAVAHAADVLITCLPDDVALEDAVVGEAGMLTADGAAPIVIQLGTVAFATVQRLGDKLAARGGTLLDCPVSGTPRMVRDKTAVIYASGAREAYERVTDVFEAIAPSTVFVGGLGAGTNLKCVANLLVFIHVAAAAEAMAFAAALGLDQSLVASVISQSPGATSGQFNIRGPLIADRRFDGDLVTVDTLRAVCGEVCARANAAGVSTPLVSVVRDLYQALAELGEGLSDPGKLSVYL